MAVKLQSMETARSYAQAVSALDLTALPLESRTTIFGAVGALMTVTRLYEDLWDAAYPESVYHVAENGDEKE